MNKFLPQPWQQPVRKYPAKYNQYFHEADNKLNSLPHSSAKIAEFYLKPNSLHKAQSSAGPESTSTENTFRKINSRERIHRRMYERELLQAKSSQCLPTFKVSENLNVNFATYKDPAKKSINSKIAGFDNYLELSQNRLKLVVNDKILKMDEEAVERISEKISQEVEKEKLIKAWHVENREKILETLKKQQKINAEYEKKNGLVKIKVARNKVIKPPSARINTLSVAKTVKSGYAQDYLDSYGLLNAGVLKSGKSMHPKSARRSIHKKTEYFPVYEDLYDPELLRKQESLEPKREIDIYKPEDIQESMQELNEFHRRFGELKGRVGFPQIHLESFSKLPNKPH